MPLAIKLPGLRTQLLESLLVQLIVTLLPFSMLVLLAESITLLGGTGAGLTVSFVVAAALCPTLFLHVSVKVVLPVVVMLNVCQDVAVVLVGPPGVSEQVGVLL